MNREVSALHLTRRVRLVRTREVAVGWADPWKLARPYPFRSNEGVEYRLVFSDGGHKGGHAMENEIEMIHHEEKGPVFIGINGDLYPLAPGFSATTDTMEVD